MNGKPWTPHQVMRARALRKNGATYSDIDRELGRPIGTTSQKLNQPEDTKSGHHVTAFYVPHDVLAERDARRAAADLRDQTAELCGDPPPGYSVLDRKRAASSKTENSANG